MATPRYTSEQLKHYLTHILLPPRCHLTSIEHLSNSDKLEHLTRLQAYTLCAVPFENLSLHYDQHHTIDIDAQVLFDKIVGSGIGTYQGHTVFDAVSRGERGRAAGRGGYCMENNCFFGIVLRSLGYDVYAAGARVMSPKGEWGGWNHMVNLVIIGGTKYQVDVGFGGNGPTCPLPLPSPNSTTWATHPNITPSVSRLIKRHPLTTSNHNAPRLWVYELLFDPSSSNSEEDWKPIYCFTETEFLPQDFEMMNHYTSTSRRLFFTYQVLCIRMIMEDELDVLEAPTLQPQDIAPSGVDEQKIPEIVGQLILTSNVKRKVRGQTEVLTEDLKTEEERVMALEKWFGIRLGRLEKIGIRGMVTALD